MSQQPTFLLSALRQFRFFQKNLPSVGWCLATLAALWLAGLHAAPNGPALWNSGEAAPAKRSVVAHAAVPAGDTSITETICANGFYVFNGDTLRDPGQYSAVLVAADGTDSIVSLDLIVLPTFIGSVKVSICEGEVYDFNGELLAISGTYQTVLAAANGCDSTVTLTLQVLPSPFTKIEAGICTGAGYIFQGDTLTESGVYTAVLPAHNGCDSVIELNLKVVPFFDVLTEASICPGDYFVFNGDTLHTAGTYVDSLTATGGCDSTVTLKLKVLPVPTTQLSAGICTGSTYLFAGDTLKVSGTYSDTLSGKNGCDSIVVLKLTVADFFDVEQKVSICAGETYAFGDTTVALEGIYVDSLSAAGGCDSTVTLVLTVLPVQTGSAETTICQGDTLDYNGESLTASGAYTFVLTGPNGCDSTVTLTLTVLPVSATALDTKICAGDTFVFNGDTLDESGVYVRVLPAANGCDSTVTLTLTVQAVQHTDLTATVCAGETYVYNSDTLDASGIYPYVFSGANGCDSTVTVALTVLEPQSGASNATICAGEVFVFDGDTLDQPGIYSFVLPGTNGCDSTVTVNLEILPVLSDSVTASTCAGTGYVFAGDTLTLAGVYTGVFIGQNGCDSTVTLTLTVLPTHSSNFTITTCANEPYTYNGTTYSTTGNYNITLTGANGCDSIVTLMLTVLPIAETSFAASICGGESYVFGPDTLKTSGTYTSVFHGVNSCDSIVTLQLTVRPLSSSHLVVSLCNGEHFVFDGDTLTASGIYTVTKPGSNGCDSTAMLDLSFAPFFETAVQASVCNGGSYMFGTDTLTVEGIYSDTLTAVGGCDSIVILTLTVLPPATGVAAATICPGETYEFNGQTFTQGGTFLVALTTAQGCDSTVTLTLTVLPVSESTTHATICPGESYPFNGQMFTASGNYPVVLTGANGCDSTATLVLTVLTVPTTNVAASICPNGAYLFDGTLLTAAGTYTATLTGANGCDSIVVLNLTVLPEATGTVAVSICNGGVLEFNGDTLTTSGTYEFVLAGAASHGCDSLVTLTLTVLPAIPPTQTSATICDGETYDFNGLSLNMTGTYMIDLASGNGCDSTVVLELTVLPKIATQFTATICSGETYPFNGQILSAAGIYSAQFQAANGCDSVVTLILAVNVVNVNVTLQNGTLTAQAGPTATYQWFNCDGNNPIAGATSSAYTPAMTGQYGVLINLNGCTDTSACQLVQVVSSFEPLAASSWSLQPNPASTEAAVVFQADLPGQMWIEIYDPAGRLLEKQTVAPGANRVTLELNGLPDGALFVRLVSEQGASTKRLMKAGN